MPLRNKGPIDPQRQLMIKTKACERLVKEVDYYHKEVEENEQQLKKMKADKKDPYDIKKFEEVLGESYMMIPDSKRRLDEALEDLKSFCESPEVQSNHTTSEWFSKAKEILSSHGRGGSKGEDVQLTSVDGLGDDEAF